MKETPEQIEADIKHRYVMLARAPHEETRFAVGANSARELGYDTAEIDVMPASVTECFAGVGNPIALHELPRGGTVLDLGCGAGLDSLLAARRIGPSGRVIGIDFTAEMVEKARTSADAVGATNAEFRLGRADSLQLEDESVDVVISNGVLNLCLDKPRVLAELQRVLRPGGRLQLADILLDVGVTPEEVERRGAWSD